MHAAVARIELRLPGVRSLKSKRSILKALEIALRTKFPVAVAEVGHQDLWQRCSLGVALVSGQAGHLDRILHTVRRFMDQQSDVEVLGVSVAYLEDPG
jgi:uncharacterized protein YlxP (DUF503 family)